MQQTTSTAETRLPVNLLKGTLDQPRETTPRKQAIAPRVVARKPSELGEALTAGERGALAECEEILERGLGTIYEVAHALLRIREGHLYRPTHFRLKPARWLFTISASRTAKSQKLANLHKLADWR
jgi:hypothetical protein